VSARDIYQFALNYIKERQPELEKHLVKNIGFAVCLGIYSAATNQ
jgi:nucleosome binding factor SPN SPT16 subunit